QHEGGDLPGHAGQELITLRHGQLARGDERIQQDLDVDLDVRGVDARGVVDEVGVEATAGASVLDAAALGQSEVAAFADHLRPDLHPVDSHAIVGAVADIGVGLRACLDVGADPTVPEQVHGQ